MWDRRFRLSTSRLLRTTSRFGANTGPSELQFPALLEYRLDELVGLGAIGEALIPAVPIQLPGDVQRNRDQCQPLGIRRADAEIGTSRVAALRGAHPVLHVARRPRQHCLL